MKGTEAVHSDTLVDHNECCGETMQVQESCCDGGQNLPDAQKGGFNGSGRPDNARSRAAAWLVEYRNPATGAAMLLFGLLADLLAFGWFSGTVRILWYTAAYLPVGLPVLRQAWEHLRKGEVFTEFFLMGIATIGAFAIGEYPEAVGVMLFYSIGEAFQHRAVHKARANIRALLDVRPVEAHRFDGASISTVHPKEVFVGDRIQVRPGERIPLDGTLLTESASVDTAAITGESVPRQFRRGEKLLAGMINLDRIIELETSSNYHNSSISRILELVQNASLRKAKTELFIRSFARIYTPVVVLLAALLVVLPLFFVPEYRFDEWLYRGLVFLVISCPCALVISIPLGYFGGIGAASRNGILIKGGNFLDALRSVDTVVFDKTGTLTRGVFLVREVRETGLPAEEWIPALLSMEAGSTHPVAKAITEALDGSAGRLPDITSQTEIAGLGIRAQTGGKTILAGNRRLMESESIGMPAGLANDVAETVVHVAVNGKHAGFITISDRIKEDAAEAVRSLRELGVHNLVMLSGDRNDVARKVGEELGLDRVWGELLPEQKAERLETIKEESSGLTAYVGDGINDAPVLAGSDVGIAMGAMGSDVAVETADVVIQADQPAKIATSIRIARATRNIVWQNILLALGVKALFLGLGALGLASLWEAVFADVGVALLAILNAVRIQRMPFP